MPSGDGLSMYIVLELCDTRNLNELVRGSILTAEFRREICRQIVSGLAYVRACVIACTRAWRVRGTCVA